MALFSKLTEQYGELVNFIIRPPRDDNYVESDLGPRIFPLQNKLFKRTDLVLMNRRTQRLQCSFFEPVEEHRSRERLPCVVYLHGNCSSRVEALGTLPVLLPQDITVFAFDFAGSGKSEGAYVSLGWWEREDLDVVIEHLRTTGRVSCIGLWGRSMGAVTALLHADRDPSIGGMVLDSPFASLRQLAEELADVVVTWKIPRFLLHSLLNLVRSTILNKANFDINNLNPLNHVDRTYVPALFVVANEDDFILPTHGEELCAKYAGDRNLVRVTGDHNSVRPRFLQDSAAIFFHTCLTLHSAAAAAAASRHLPSTTTAAAQNLSLNVAGSLRSNISTLKRHSNRYTTQRATSGVAENRKGSVDSRLLANATDEENTAAAAGGSRCRSSSTCRRRRRTELDPLRSSACNNTRVRCNSVRQRDQEKAQIMRRDSQTSARGTAHVASLSRKAAGKTEMKGSASSSSQLNRSRKISGLQQQQDSDHNSSSNSSSNMTVSRSSTESPSVIARALARTARARDTSQSCSTSSNNSHNMKSSVKSRSGSSSPLSSFSSLELQRHYRQQFFEPAAAAARLTMLQSSCTSSSDTYKSMNSSTSGSGSSGVNRGDSFSACYEGGKAAVVAPPPDSSVKTRKEASLQQPQYQQSSTKIETTIQSTTDKANNRMRSKDESVPPSNSSKRRASPIQPSQREDQHRYNHFTDMRRPDAGWKFALDAAGCDLHLVSTVNPSDDEDDLIQQAIALSLEDYMNRSSASSRETLTCLGNAAATTTAAQATENITIPESSSCSSAIPHDLKGMALQKGQQKEEPNPHAQAEKRAGAGRDSDGGFVGVTEETWQPLKKEFCENFEEGVSAADTSSLKQNSSCDSDAKPSRRRSSSFVSSFIKRCDHFPTAADTAPAPAVSAAVTTALVERRQSADPATAPAAESQWGFFSSFSGSSVRKKRNSVAENSTAAGGCAAAAASSDNSSKQQPQRGSLGFLSRLSTVGRGKITTKASR